MSVGSTILMLVILEGNEIMRIKNPNLSVDIHSTSVVIQHVDGKGDK